LPNGLFDELGNLTTPDLRQVAEFPFNARRQLESHG
jgi:hypothetical protein